ncbi:MAG TPA: peptidoglycan DD-metalloendopeptidase family protein [Beijerinckiaceae bacterium]|jgi:septal ring factor EnvC (AmiA/AmiB activator)
MTRSLALPLATFLALSLGALSALAQAPAPSARAAETAEEKARREGDLKAVRDAIAASEEARRRLEAEITEIRTDRAKLNAALIEAAQRTRQAENRIGGLEQRLRALTGSEAAIRRSLETRRDVIVEVLAALQRMGRRPPPAVLARPEDMLAAVRASILLGAVVPELRGEAEVLAADLAELVRLKGQVGADREALGRELAGLEQEKTRLAGLVGARQERLAAVERTQEAERDRAADLATQARTLKDLIDAMERDIAAGRRASDEAKRAAESQAQAAKERFAAAAFRDPARLSPKIPFTEARGLLPLPVGGEVAKDFGVPDGYGGTTRGISIATRLRAVVASPSDGWVAFAGPFRSYGRLLIINAGGGYYLLLAGMDQINVEVGQFVLAGEPVGVMGETASASPASGVVDTKDPVLYVEFRKDGGSIDPGPWWAKSQSEKVRG